MTTAKSAQLATLQFHPDGILLATGHSDGKMNIWDLRT